MLFDKKDREIGLFFVHFYLLTNAKRCGIMSRPLTCGAADIFVYWQLQQIFEQNFVHFDYCILSRNGVYLNHEREVHSMYKVYNQLDLLIMVTDDEEEADFFAWLNNGYFI